MPWFKVDDALALHMKAITAGNAALGLWVRAGSWSMQQLTDGFIPNQIVAALGATTADAAALVSARLWDAAPGGFQFHDWAEYQPTREQVLAERADAAERMRRVRANRKAHVRANEQPNEARTFGDGSASPSRPVPLTDSYVSESSPDPAVRETTDAIEPSKTEQAMAAQMGLTAVAAIAEQVRKHTGRTVDVAGALAVSRHLLGKARGEPRVPQRYVIGAISRSPFEVQQFIDERGIS